MDLMTKAAAVKCLAKAADIVEAADWCLTNISSPDVQILASILRPLADNFAEDRPEIAEILKDLRYPRNRKSSWSLACAVLAKDAWYRSDTATFWAAGIEVLKAMQQGKRGTHHNRNAHIVDLLDNCIVEYLSDFPRATPAEIFLSFSELAGYSHEVIVEHDQGSEELVCQLDKNSEKLTNVGREEFSRRVRRATGCA